MASYDTSASVGAAVSGFGANNSVNIQALWGGTRWGLAVAGTGATVTYSFPWTTSTTATWYNDRFGFYGESDEPDARYHYGFDFIERSAAREVMQAWADVANLKLLEVAETASGSVVGDIRLAYSSAVSSMAWGHAYLPASGLPEGGDIWLNPTNQNEDTDWRPGSYNYESLLHEVGHALGLKHPGSYDGSGRPPFLPSGLDSVQYTVMSYNDDYPLFRKTIGGVVEYIAVEPQTPMVLDIQAIQALYGANNTFRTGNDTYTFDRATPFLKTLWDAGGNDTISVSNFSQGCRIDLTPGSYSSIRMISDALPAGGVSLVDPTYTGESNLGIAYGTVIENAIGGQGFDVLTGNSAANKLKGGQGADHLNGGGGRDTALYDGLKSDYTLTRSFGSVWTVQSAVEGNDSLVEIERLQFADGWVALDIEANAGQAYRLYQAAFDRKPDAGGLGYQINELDGGKALAQVALNFISSPEFSARYGKLDNNQFVTQLYANVLHRAPDAAGLGFHVGNLASGANTRANVLVGFSESPENQAALIGTIGAGIAFTL